MGLQGCSEAGREKICRQRPDATEGRWWQDRLADGRCWRQVHRLAITKPQNARQVTIMTDMTGFQAETRWSGWATCRQTPSIDT